MHADEVDIDADVVRRLVIAQHPQWADLEIEPVTSTGTVNAIWRLGADMYVRLPRIESWAGHLDNEVQWLPMLATHLSLDVPRPIAVGQPQFGYPFQWAIFAWLEGEVFVPGAVDEHRAAADLAQFIAELRGVATRGAPPSRRDRPLHALDAQVHAAINAAGEFIDAEAVASAWDEVLQASPWSGAPVWVHGDLLPPNALVLDGRISAIIDFGGVGVGDPAVDVIAAWSMLDESGRAVFRTALGIDDATWARARGLALHQALMIIAYYVKSNAAFVAMAQRTVNQITGST
jgi:aminoglycoside phosphotransferase (APT) family kinase protein